MPLLAFVRHPFETLGSPRSAPFDARQTPPSPNILKNTELTPWVVTEGLEVDVHSTVVMVIRGFFTKDERSASLLLA